MYLDPLQHNFQATFPHIQVLTNSQSQKNVQTTFRNTLSESIIDCHPANIKVLNQRNSEYREDPWLSVLSVDKT